MARDGRAYDNSPNSTYYIDKLKVNTIHILDLKRVDLSLEFNNRLLGAGIEDAAAQAVWKQLTVPEFRDDQERELWLSASASAAVAFSSVVIPGKAGTAKSSNLLARMLAEWPPGLPKPGEVDAEDIYPGRVDAEAFLRDRWGPFLNVDGGDGTLTQPRLRLLDAKLMKALENYFEGKKDELASLVPSIRSMAKAKYREEFGEEPPTDPEQRRIMMAGASILRSAKRK